MGMVAPIRIEGGPISNAQSSTSQAKAIPCCSTGIHSDRLRAARKTSGKAKA
jgi:hypothetical protein